MKRVMIPAVVLLAGVLAGCGPSKKDCSTITCGAGQICDPNTVMCIPNPDKCAGVMCGANQVCNMTTGMCESTMVDKCMGVTCGATQNCDRASGMCVEKCMGVTCSMGQVCEATTGLCKDPTPPRYDATKNIDRMGRPGVNTALTNPFERPELMLNETSDQTKDKYNADASVAMWPANYAARYVRQNLAILDSVDVAAAPCGNQLGANLNPMMRYLALAQLLSADWLNVNLNFRNTAANSCLYLGAELRQLGVVMTDNCGGRPLAQDVIDVTFRALTTGNLNDAAVSDGVGNTSTFQAAFPYLANPQ